MKRFLITSAAVFVALVVWRLFDMARIDRIGDVVSLGVLTVTAALEGVIVGGGIWRYTHDPRVAAMQRAKAMLELDKVDKARRMRFFMRGY